MADLRAPVPTRPRSEGAPCRPRRRSSLTQAPARPGGTLRHREMAPPRRRDYLILAGLMVSTLLVVPIAAAYAGLVEVDVGTGLLTVALAACIGFPALDSLPGRRL